MGSRRWHGTVALALVTGHLMLEAKVFSLLWCITFGLWVYATVCLLSEQEDK